jgi:hypothetical protein
LGIPYESPVAKFGITGQTGVPVDINLFIPIADALRVLALDVATPPASAAPAQVRAR